MVTYFWILWLTICFCSITANKSTNSDDSITNQGNNVLDLNFAASSYYPEWADIYASRGYGVTGYSSLDDLNSHGDYNDHQYNRRNNREPILGQGYLGGYDGKSAYIGYTGYKNGLEYNTLGNNIVRVAYPGNGGYGGYGGNDGLSSYLGYNNPNYHGANHLGYGYYKKPIHSGIYGNGITPSLVTGYRGYSKK